MAWIRLYDDVLHDAKIDGLTAPQFRFWIKCLLVAKRRDTGRLPAVDALASLTKTTVPRCKGNLTVLSHVQLLDRRGDAYSIHNWSARQYKSDSSTPRVKRFRERSSNVPVTPPDTETEQRQKQSSDPSDRLRPQPEPWPDSLFKSANGGEAVAAIIDYWRERGHEVDDRERGMIAAVVTKHGSGKAVAEVVEQAWKKAGPAKYLTEVLNAKRDEGRGTGGKRVATNADAAEAKARF